MRLVVLGLGLVLLLTQGVDADQADTFAPAGSTAVLLEEEVAVSWQPGREVADSYRVYGLDEHGRTLLAEWLGSNLNDARLTVPAGFADYGVTGVHGESESALVMATEIGLGDRPCITIEPRIPPGYWINCLPTDLPGDMALKFDLPFLG